MAKITIPSIFGSPTSKKHSRPLQQRSEDSLPVASRPSSGPLSPRSKSVRTPPSARFRAQLHQLRPQSTVSRTDSNASSPRVESDESGKKGVNSAKHVKEGDVKNGRHTPVLLHQDEEERVVNGLGNGKSMEANGKNGETKARNTREGRHAPNSPPHDSEDTPELLLVLKEVRRKREAAERREWLDKWEGFADTLGSNIDLSLGTPKKDGGENTKKELSKAKSSNWLSTERPKPLKRFPSDEKGYGMSERQKAMARLPIEEHDSPMGKGISNISLPLDGEESPSERNRPIARVPMGETKGWENSVEEKEVISKGKRNYTPSERQAALSRLPVEEQRKLTGSHDDDKQDEDETIVNGKGGKASASPEGDAPAIIHFSPRTLRTYVTLNPATKNSFELSPVPKRSTRSPANKARLYPAPRTSSRSFSDTHHSPDTGKSRSTSTSAKSRSALKGPPSSSIPQLALPEDIAGNLKAEYVVAQWQAIREALWYDSDEEEDDYAERMKLTAIRSVLNSGTTLG